MTVTATVPVDDGRATWAALPRRRPPARPARLLAIRTPISARARTVLTALSILLPLLAWQVLSRVVEGDPDYLPSPAQSLAAGAEMARTGQLWTDTWASVQRVLEGFGIAVAISVPLGILMGSFVAGNAALEPFLGMVRYLPAAAFTPLLLLWLGLEEAPKLALIAVGTVFFNTLMSADVVRQVPRDLIDVSYTLGARRGEVLRKVIIPHALPGLIDAVRVNFAAAWNLLVVAELLAAEAGLGFRIARAARFVHVDQIFAVLIVIGVIGVVTDVSLRLLRDRVGRWVA
jgi:NitT/TauT family transport system permease protein